VTVRAGRPGCTGADFSTGREGTQITRFSRRRFLLGALALTAGCGAPRKTPPLKELYARRSGREQPPLIVIPGAFGSRLVDTRTGAELWPRSSARLLFSNYKLLEVEIDEDTLDPVGGLVRPSEVFREGLGQDFYGRILDTLEQVGGYRRRRPGDPVEPGQRNYYVFLYDWRLDNVAAVAGLHKLIQRIRADYGDPHLQLDVLAHSNGGLLARYYARFGASDVLAAPDARPSFAGAPAIRRLLLGTPNLGSMQPVLSHVRGEEIGLRHIPAEVVATTSGAPQLMPHPAVPWLVDVRGDTIASDIFDIATWRDYGWSIFDPRVRARSAARKGGGAAGRRYMAILEQYLARHLQRGRNFLLLMSQPGDSRDVRPFVFGGDCDATVARLVVEEVRGRMLARERPEAVLKPLPGVDYHDLIYEPGDAVVTRASLLGRCPDTLRPGAGSCAALWIAHSVFMCEQHLKLTGNPTFQNNLLHTLLGRDVEVGANGAV